MLGGTFIFSVLLFALPSFGLGALIGWLIGQKKILKKGQGFIPETLIKWVLALAALALIIAIAIIFKDQIIARIDKLFEVFRFGR